MDVPVNLNDGVVTVTASTNGQKIFPFDFLAYNAADIAAIHKRGATKTAIAQGSGFSATGLGVSAGGTIDITASGIATLVGDKVTIYRNIPVERIADYADDFRAEVVNREFDTIFMLLQDVKRDVGRAPLVDYGETPLTVAQISGLLDDVDQVADDAAQVHIDAVQVAADRVVVAANKALVDAAKALVDAAAAAALASKNAAGVSETNVEADRVDVQADKVLAIQAADAAVAARVATEAARDATLAAYDSFDDRYLGAKASAPTLDNDGNALAGGMLYFDTVAGAMQVYNGSAWVAAYVSGTGFLAAASNLGDLTNFTSARTNLDVYSTTQTDARWQITTLAAAAKTVLVSGDLFSIVDSAASNVIKKFTYGNLLTALNLLYVGLSGAQAIGGVKTFSSIPVVPAASFSLAQLTNGAALSVPGVAGNAAAVRTDIAAGTDGFVLRRSGTTLGFGLLVAANITDAVITYAKMAAAAIATATEYRSATASKLLDAAGVWAGMAEVVATPAQVVTGLDLNTGFDFSCSLVASISAGNFTNVIPGQRGRIRFLQDATGGRVVTKASNWKTPGGAALSLPTGANAVGYMYYDCRASGEVLVSASPLAWS